MLSVIRQARAMAANRGRYVAVRFHREEEGYRFAIYEDGNGNGVREADIKNGVDREISTPEKIESRFPGVQVRIVDRSKISKIPPAGGDLKNHHDPVKFGNSDLISFSPLGSSSSGTLYLSAGRYDMAGVKVFGPTVRIQIWIYDYFKDGWRKMK
jgi:hypothetical protein